jgi:hypothetical protein
VRAPHLYGGKGLAITGIVSSIVGFLIIFGIFLFYGAALFWLGGTP